MDEPKKLTLNGLIEWNKVRAKSEADTDTIIEKYNDTSARENRISTIVIGTVEGDPSFLENIIYINMSNNIDRNVSLTSELSNFEFTQNTTLRRFEGVPQPGNGAKGCYLSHLHALAFGCSLGTHITVLEDDFTFNVSRADLESYLQQAETATQGRWDVIVLGQYVHKWQQFELFPSVFRILHGTTTSGYIVNRNHIRDLLLKFHQEFLLRAHVEKFEHDDNLDQIQVMFQTQDIWLGFEKSMGAQRAGLSIIGNQIIHNSWVCNATFDKWRTPAEHLWHDLVLVTPAFRSQRVALCFVATGKYIQYLQSVMQSCVQRFVKPHMLEFFVFTDDLKAVPESCQHAYFVERKGFPGDTLYRYHYILTAEKDLQNMSHIFYMDVDYWVCNATDNDKLLVSDGLVATAHLHNLHVTDSNQFHRGTPDTNPHSTAYVSETTKMVNYYCGGFQGGKASSFLTACREMKQNIDIDDTNHIMAAWHDESHWNRYLIDHPPQAILTQSYVYPEQCLDANCDEENCVALRRDHIKPVMVALSKNHKSVRL